MEHAAGGLDRIVGNRLDHHPAAAGRGHQDHAPRPEPDLLAQMGRDHHLPLGRGFNDGHDRSPVLGIV
jgi:hypothetical protein